MNMLNVEKIKMRYRNILLNSLASSPICTPRLRRCICRIVGHEVQNMFSNCFIGFGPGKLNIGKGTYCNNLCYFDLGADITIGENCNIAMQVSFINNTHEIGTEQRRGGKGLALPIVIEDGCWIGGRVTILPGVTVRQGCVIAAGALVTKDTLPNGLYAGVPAKLIRKL